MKRLLLSLFIFITSIPSFALLNVKTKPNITILATGGTIAGSSDSKTDTTYYKSGSLSIEKLIKVIPELSKAANLQSEQFTNIDSNDMTDDTLLRLSKKVNALLAKPDKNGVVITHGTDTLEESAFFLDITVNNDKPVVFVGAMRPATALSADGPMNLLQSVLLAGSKDARGRGTLIMMNNQIDSGFYTTKTNPSTNDAFKAPLVGYLGIYSDKGPMFYYKPAKPFHKPYFDISQITALPRVDIIYVHQGLDDTFLQAAIKAGAKGLIIDATGNGNMPKKMLNAVAKLHAEEFPVIIASRTGSGYVSPKSYAINSGFLNAQKSRVLLQLAIATGASNEQIAKYFDPCSSIK